MSKELIVEEHLTEATVIESEALPTGGKRLVFEAVVSEGDHINRNRRQYPLGVLWPAFEQVNQDITAYPGAVNHPRSGSAGFEDNGIKWHAFWLEGNLIKGKGEIIWTQRGRDLAANIEAGIKVGFSTRTYAAFEDIEVDGLPVRRAVAMDPPYVDAVTTPSVRHAQLAAYAREEQEQMEEQLREAQAALEAAQSRISELESQLSTANESHEQLVSTERSRAEEAESKLAESQERIAALESELAEAKRADEEAQLRGRILELTQEHRFGAAIRTELDGLRESGIPVSLENVEALIGRITPLVEAAGARANEDAGTPRGELSTDEDVVSESDPRDELTEEQKDELRAMGL